MPNMMMRCSGRALALRSYVNRLKHPAGWLGPVFCILCGRAWAVHGFFGSFAHLLMLAGILRCGYDSVTYENVQYPNKVRAHLDIPANEIALAGIVLSYRSDDKANSHRSPRSGGRGDFNDHIRRE